MSVRSLPGSGRRQVRSWGAGLASGGVLVLDPASVVFAAILFAPAILIRLVDDSHDRSAARSVMLCNLAGAVGPFVRLWRIGPPDLARAFAILSDPMVVCVAWLAGAVAWLGSEFLTALAYRSLHVRDARAITKTTAEIDRLRDEWGKEN